jgi:hypothetical protein
MTVRMATVTGTFGWLRSIVGLPTLVDMALASIQGSAAEASTGPVDAYLVEIYRQVAESARPIAAPRYARLTAFLGFVGVVTTALAILVSMPDDAGAPGIPALCLALATTGLLVAAAFFAVEVHAHRALDRQAIADAGADATSTIYLASTGFFAFTVAIALGLLVVR